jgi:hypothetical protein
MIHDRRQLLWLGIVFLALAAAIGLRLDGVW